MTKEKILNNKVLIPTIIILILIILLMLFLLFTRDKKVYDKFEDDFVDEVISYNNELHVYNTEQQAILNDGYSSINEAINNAKEDTVIYVHEGTYREEIRISKKEKIGIVAYEDDEVFVTSTEVVNSFKPYRNGIYVANTPNIEVPFTQLFVDGKAEDMARFPNKTIESSMEVFEDGGGYSYLSDMYKNTSGPAYVKFNDNIPNVDLTGAIFKGLIGKNREYPVGTVVSSKNNVIGFNAITNNDWKNGTIVKDVDHLFGFGYLHHKNLIDIPGEWYLEDNKLYYMPNGNINNLNIEMQVRESVLTMSNSNNVEINNIHFYGGNSEIKKVNNFTFRNSSMQHMSGFYMKAGYGDYDSAFTGIFMQDSDNLVVRNTYVGNTFGNGFYLDDVNNSIFSNSIMENIGASGIFTSGIYKNHGDLDVRNCTFNENGRFQVRIRGNGQVNLIDNVFNGSMKLGEDAGPIEMTSTGSVFPLDLKESTIAYNVVSDVRGIPVSGEKGNYVKQFVKAFYMEDVHNYTAHHNIVRDIKATNSLHMVQPIKEKFNKNLILESGFIYLGPRFNELTKPVNYFNNTAYNYDTNVSIWHIQVDNYKDLGMKHDGGKMSNANFVNNALEDKTLSILYQTKNLKNLTGSFEGGNLTSDSFKSNNFDEFDAKLDNVDYHLNPKNNILVEESLKQLQYIDPLNGDFRLSSNSIYKNAGIVIKGITSSKNPDVGALEGSDRVLKSGSYLEFNFKI